MKLKLLVIGIVGTLLIGCGGDSSSGASKPEIETLNKAPLVNAGLDRKTEINKAITIIGTASDSDGNISAYEWKKGSIVLATTPSFSYLPTIVGTDVLTLVVTDNEALTSSDSMNVIVHSIPIIPDTTPPTKPTLTVTPTTTTADSQSVEVNGEVNATVWLNGVNKGTIGSTGKLTIILDTSGTDGIKTFSIILKDASDNKSETLLLNIEKTTAFIPDTTPPTKPTLTVTPTTTTANTQSVEVNGEVNATVWLNGVNKGTIDSTGKLTIVLDTSGTDGRKTFSIILKDASDNKSEALLLNIEKTTESTRVVSDETYYKYLWHIDSENSSTLNIVEELANATGRESWTDNIDPNADINILEAWKITKGKGVKVAVIDDGGDVNHEDLKENIFLTYNIDGKSDDIYHYSDNITHASHGNSCAGFIASPINGKGIIGIAPESKLILIRQEEEADSATIEAFEYAKNNGAKVISCSWGTNAVSEAIVAELKSLYVAGITVVFASGNEGSNLDEEGINDESEVPWVIGVGASSELNDVTEYSNYGLNIDIIAPGGNHSTSIGILALDDSGTQGSTSNYGAVSNHYAFTDGTSFATPIVAGVIALMYSVNPDITPKEVRDILISTADKVGGNKADYWDGFDQQRAYGKINALKAIHKAQE